MQREWSFARTVRRPGENGADLALLEAIHEEVSTGRIGRIYLGTGDGLFTDSARWLLDRGHEVTVVSRPSALSWKLRRAVHGNVLYLPDLSRGV
jgi:precorrin-6B methylase 1